MLQIFLLFICFKCDNFNYYRCPKNFSWKFNGLELRIYLFYRVSNILKSNLCIYKRRQRAAQSFHWKANILSLEILPIGFMSERNFHYINLLPSKMIFLTFSLRPLTKNIFSDTRKCNITSNNICLNNTFFFTMHEEFLFTKFLL